MLARYGVVSLASLALLAAAFQACATGEPEPANDAGGTGGIGGEEGGGGGDGGLGDGGTNNTLCGMDCGEIPTMPCFKAVCNDGSILGPVGSCVVVHDDGALCDDGKFCTIGDVCNAGECNGSLQNQCGIVPTPCQQVSCNEDAESCSTSPADNGTQCISSDLCLIGATCQNGLCTGGIRNDCLFAPDPGDCLRAVCNSDTGDCEPVPGFDGEACVDPNDLCMVNKTCALGACAGGTPKDCSSLDVGCQVGICHAATGACVAQTLMDGASCNDNDACTSGETCDFGTCGSGNPITLCSMVADGCCPFSCTPGNDLDCACTSENVATSYASTSGWDGIMFDITAVNDIEVKTFDFNIDPGMKDIEIYARVGTHSGFETDAAAWTMVGSVSVDPSAANVATPIPLAIDIAIPAGMSHAFYITTTNGGTTSNGINYVLSVPTGAIQAQDANMQIRGGKGKGYPFGTNTFVDRGVSATVHYEVCGT